MDINLEQRIIKALLSYSFYERVKNILTKDLFSGVHALIVSLIKETQETHKTNLSLEDIKALYFELHPPTTANRTLLLGVFDAIDMEKEINDNILIELLKKLHIRLLAHKIGSSAADVINDTSVGLEAFRQMEEWLANREVVEETIFEEVSSDIKDLLDKASPENHYSFRLPSLQDAVGGVAPGHNIIVFGRPEVGKSSFIADCVVGFLEQGLKVVYFANEEPGWKIMLNHVRTCMEMSDKELQVQKDFSKWEALRKNLVMYDETGVSMESVSQLCNRENPHILILDQSDKFTLENSSRSSISRTERLAELYVASRGIAKGGRVVFNVSQASAEAHDHREVTYDMLDYSKTGKAAEADLIIGIGKDAGITETFQRYLTLSKNKISGNHAFITALFVPLTNTWSV